ncbi:hypothetical protein MKW92_021275, partial [Papaver armeniacum]
MALLRLGYGLRTLPTISSELKCLKIKQSRVGRRLLLGIGTPFLGNQFLKMAGNSSSTGGGGKYFLASAKQPSAPPIEEILKNVDWPADFPYTAEDFQRFD